MKRNEEKCFYWSVMNDFICNQCIVISFQASNYIWPKTNSEATVTTISTRVKGLKSTMRSFGGLRILWKISIYKSLLKNEYENLIILTLEELMKQYLMQFILQTYSKNIG